MLKVIVGNNVTRSTAIVSENTTPRQVLEQNEVDYTRGATNLNGCTLSVGDLDKSFEALGVKDQCYLLNVAKADNA